MVRRLPVRGICPRTRGLRRNLLGEMLGVIAQYFFSGIEARNGAPRTGILDGDEAVQPSPIGQPDLPVARIGYFSRRTPRRLSNQSRCASAEHRAIEKCRCSAGPSMEHIVQERTSSIRRARIAVSLSPHTLCLVVNTRSVARVRCSSVPCATRTALMCGGHCVCSGTVPWCSAAWRRTLARCRVLLRNRRRFVARSTHDA
jgi:hypothetical protein